MRHYIKNGFQTTSSEAQIIGYLYGYHMSDMQSLVYDDEEKTLIMYSGREILWKKTKYDPYQDIENYMKALEMPKYTLSAITEGGKELLFSADSLEEAAAIALNKGIVSEKGKISKGFMEAKIIKEGEDIEEFSFHWYGVMSPYQYDWPLP